MPRPPARLALSTVKGKKGAESKEVALRYSSSTAEARGHARALHRRTAASVTAVAARGQPLKSQPAGCPQNKNNPREGDAISARPGAALVVEPRPRRRASWSASPPRQRPYVLLVLKTGGEGNTVDLDGDVRNPFEHVPPLGACGTLRRRCCRQQSRPACSRRSREGAAQATRTKGQGLAIN